MGRKKAREYGNIDVVFNERFDRDFCQRGHPVYSTYNCIIMTGIVRSIHGVPTRNLPCIR